MFSRLSEQKGVLVPEDFLPNSYKIADEIQSKYHEHCENFLNNQLPTASTSGFACTADFSQSGPDYCVITLHFADSDW